MVKRELNSPDTSTVRRFYLNYQLEIAKYRQEKIAGWLSGLVGWFCDCMMTDIDKADTGKKQLINECITKSDIEKFDIPNIAQETQKGKLDETI